MITKNSYVLPVIVISQFACTSLWFAGYAVISNVIKQFGLSNSAFAYITSSVQLGFIFGTLVFAIFSISDRFSPSKVFFWCAIAGAISNLLMLVAADISTVIVARSVTGFFLAGIYPVGMKIASDYHDKGLGKALGFLVGALVLGTAFPHLLKSATASYSWKSVMVITSLLAVAGGASIQLFVPDGPYRTPANSFKANAIFMVFKSRKFKAAAFGYFGHMWELYTFWAFVPVLLIEYQKLHSDTSFSIPLVSFFIIGVGCIGCISGGYISLKIGNAKTALIALCVSCACCLLSPLLFHISFVALLSILIIWSFTVVADSPQFSTMVARYAPSNIKGTALTLVNSIGFFITIVSIQFLSFISTLINPHYTYTLLALGPLIGLIAMRPLFAKTEE